MTQIDLRLDDPKDFKLFLYPDNQPSTQLVRPVTPNFQVLLEARLTHADMVLHLLQAVEILRHQGCTVTELRIPYLMAARSDRRNSHESSFDLRVIARLINSLAIPRVRIFHPHSDVALGMIENSEAILPTKLLRLARTTVFDDSDTRPLLISPDAGAVKHAPYYMDQLWASEEPVVCLKHRNPLNGVLSLEVLHPERVNGRHCVLVDDLCDGGGTFILTAQYLKPFKPKGLTLVVSHGLFTQGIGPVADEFTRIFTTTSYRAHPANPWKHVFIRPWEENL